MSKLSDLLIEEQETGRRAVLMFAAGTATEAIVEPTAKPVAETAAEAAKETVTLVAAQKPVDPNVSYWRLCYTVVLAAGKVAEREKLILNYQDENTRHKVAPIVENRHYYSDGIESVCKARLAAMEEYFQAVDRLNKFSYEHGRDRFAPMKLLSSLYEKKARDSYKRHIKSYEEEAHPPIALDEIQV